MEVTDFSFAVVPWDASHRRVTRQLERLQQRVTCHSPDVVVIIGIPRHHAKRLVREEWSKEYYLSKEPKQITASRPRSQESAPAPPLITLAFSRYPLTSEEWFPLDDTILDGATVPEPSPFAHVFEVCIPLNAWNRDRSPVGLLQEYQVTYDEVSSITFVALAEGVERVDGLMETFGPQRSISNSVVMMIPMMIPGKDVNIEGEQIDVGTRRVTCIGILRYFRVTATNTQAAQAAQAATVCMVSTLGESGIAFSSSGEEEEDDNAPSVLGKKNIQSLRQRADLP